MKPFPFQQATVAAAVARLEGKGRRRFLVADEVGLGKTVVASEVIRQLSRDGSKRFTVYYVTSNTKVSDQNARRLVDFLGSASKSAVSGVDRLGLIPLEKPARRLRLHPFAPITSFAPLAARPQTGKAGERAFVSWLLETLLSGNPRSPSQGAATATRQVRVEGRPSLAPNPWRWRSPGSSSAPIGQSSSRLSATTRASASLKRPRQRTDWLKVLAKLRRALAEACLLARPPDLVIFDEFQRYRDLLAPARDGPAVASTARRRERPPALRRFCCRRRRTGCSARLGRVRTVHSRMRSCSASSNSLEAERQEATQNGCFIASAQSCAASPRLPTSPLTVRSSTRRERCAGRSRRGFAR